MFPENLANGVPTIYQAFTIKWSVRGHPSRPDKSSDATKPPGLPSLTGIRVADERESASVRQLRISPDAETNMEDGEDEFDLPSAR